MAAELAPAYLEHFRNMVDSGNGHGTPVKLEYVAATMPTSFVVVTHDRATGDGGDLIWQIHQHDPVSPDKLRILGIFIVRDPDGILVPVFVNWFHLIDNEQADKLTRAALADRHDY